jgi:hypothetical protein
LYLSIDSKSVVMLDMSSAFDTVHHPSLLQSLSSLGIVDDALKWMELYLSGRTQVVTVNKVLGTPRIVSHGVPQGSVLGPLLFTLYINDIGKIISSHGIKYHCYADDIQLYISTRSCDILVNIVKLEDCIAEIISFLRSKFLSINCAKSEVILFGNKCQLNRCPPIKMKIGDDVIPSSEFVRDLGVYLDQHLSMDRHVNHVVSTSFSYIRLISRIRRSLSKNVCKQLVHALVFSRLDYCSSLFYGLPKKSINKLQRVIHASVRLIEKLRKSDEISASLKKHKIFSVQKRIEKRALTILFKSLHNMAPSYLVSLLDTSSSVSRGYRTRSQTQELLLVRRCNMKTGDRAFSVYGPLLWNKIPGELRDIDRLSTFIMSITKHIMNID